MYKQLTAILAFILMIPSTLYSQMEQSEFWQIDSFAKNVEYKIDIYTLTHDLTNPYSKELHKARAIFKWITENIAYDYKYFNTYFYKGKDPKSYTCKENEDCEAKRLDWETTFINKILKKKKAVCNGYAILFNKMCSIAGLKSVIIEGYTRTKFYQIGSIGTLDHAWNAVWIDTAYFLLDATWAAGFCDEYEDGKLISFHKSFNAYYWLTSPNDFARNHFPKNSQWALLANYSKDKFAANPYYAADEINNIQLILPTSGILNAQKGDTIKFKIQYLKKIFSIQINSNIFRNPDIWFLDENNRKKVYRIDSFALKKQQYIHYRKIDDVYEFDYIVTDNSLYFLDILFNQKRVMRFKVNRRK